MEQHLLASLLYFLITLLFSWNLKQLYKKYSEKKISISTILATVSLIVTFLALTIHFLSDHVNIVIAAQVYLLLTMLYIKLFSKK